MSINLAENDTPESERPDVETPETSAEAWQNMQAQARPLAEPPETTTQKIIKWLHLATTGGILVFAIQQYQNFVTERASVSDRISRDREQVAERIAVIETKIASLQGANPGATREQLDNIRQSIAAISDRIDIHRDDIRQLQNQFVTHIQQDNRRFDRAGVK